MSLARAVMQAKEAWEEKETADKETRVNNVVELAEWKLFSNRQISHLTGVRMQKVAGYTGKTDTSGGGLTGESLEHILEIIFTRNRGEVNDLQVRDAHDAGASTRMISRLTGIPQSTVSRATRRHKDAA